MFCVVKGLETLGTAKLLESNANECVVEFFDSPGISGRSIHTVARTRVMPRDLSFNTRVYHHDPGTSGWMVGRVLNDSDETTLVRFPNKVDKVLSHDTLFVRWRKPILDPTTFLSHRITETPQYANARSGFLDSYVAQRAAAKGISGLISSTIELEEHQIRVISRVLNDASQRYLLADEVGLGKTIEAGIIIRQAVLDDPKAHRIVVLTPPSLIHQWRTELSDRFGLSDLLDDSVFVHSLQDYDEITASLRGATMLVIDEAHHLTSIEDSSTLRTYDLVRRHARSIDRLLLLSATPALRNEAGFLRMLHLLDPLVYRLEDEAAFKHKVAHRQTLAETVAFLTPENVLSLDPVLDDLARTISTDGPLQTLIGNLKATLASLPDQEDPELQLAILQLRTHLSETYRLNRRILRNRRKRLRFVTPERQGADCSTVPGSWAKRAEGSLEDWRQHALALASRNPAVLKELSLFYADVVTALLEDPRKVRSLCTTRSQTLTTRSEASFREELSLLEVIGNAVSDEAWFRARLESLTENLERLVRHRKKVVVFCASETTATEVFSYLERARALAAVRHSTDAAAEESWQRFVTDSNVKTIVCGPLAEEGINLQGSDRTIVHFDLPLAPNRIEQRMGRVDRYGSGSTIRSTVLLDQGSQLQKGWFDLLDRGLGVFHRSIASLQYLLQDELPQLRSRLIQSGTESFDVLTREYAGPDGKVTRELRLLDQQDALDELSPSSDSFFESLEDVDSNWKQIGKAVDYWAVDTLLFARSLERDAASVRAPDPPYRFRYQRAKSGGPATLIPLGGFLYDFLGALDVEAPGASSGQPLSHRYSAHRKTAITRHARVLRYGDVFMDALKSFSETDDRGRAFGIWRQHDHGPETGFSMYFRFDFLVEGSLEAIEQRLQEAELLQSAAARAAVRRRMDGVLAPAAIRIWLTEDGEPADEPLVERCLALPYSREVPGATHSDTNLSAPRLHALALAYPEIFSAWQERCAALSARAQVLVRTDADLRLRQDEAMRNANRTGAVRAAQLGARIQRLEGTEAENENRNLLLEVSLYEALLAGIATPSISLDLVGFVLLSREPLGVLPGSDDTGL